MSGSISIEEGNGCVYSCHFRIREREVHDCRDEICKLFLNLHESSNN